jgi:lactoylglutathione lyase
MILSHLNLTVADAVVTQAFLVKYFGLRPMEGVEPKSSFAMVRDDHGMLITMIRAKRDHEPEYPPTFHIGFGFETEEQVDAMHRRLTEDGYTAGAPERSHAYTFYVRAPGGFDVEVMAP